MTDDDKIRCLVDLISGKHIKPRESIACLKTKEFLRSLRIVMSAKEVALRHNYNIDFGDYFKEISSDESYVRFIAIACLIQNEYDHSKLESFICVCALAKFFSDKILQTLGVDYSDWNSDIIMALYNDKMKKSIQRSGGFQKLYKYILYHKYTKWRWNKIDLDSLDNSTELVNAFQEDLDGKLMKEINEENDFISRHRVDLCEICRKNTHLIKLILSTTIVKLPITPSEPDETNKLVESQQNEMVEETPRIERAVEEETLGASWQECLISNSISLTNQESEENGTGFKMDATCRIEATAKHETSPIHLEECSSTNCKSIINREAEQNAIERYENIIKKVIRCNNSKSSNSLHCNNPIQSEVDGVIDHLKETFKLFAEVLEEFDEV